MVARSVQCSAILQIADVGRRCKVMKEWCKTVQRGAKQCKGVQRDAKQRERVQSGGKGWKGVESSPQVCKVMSCGAQWCRETCGQGSRQQEGKRRIGVQHHGPTAQQHTTQQCRQIQATLKSCYTCLMPCHTAAAHAGLYTPCMTYLLTCQVSMPDRGHAAQKCRHITRADAPSWGGALASANL